MVITVSGDGSGNGSGDGNGLGNGFGGVSGNGDGHGLGNGIWDVSGNGCGSGNWAGDGNGLGCGNGDLLAVTLDTDGLIKVGCHCKTFEDWELTWKEEAKEHNVSEKDAKDKLELARAYARAYRTAKTEGKGERE
jgi:hypothetical protein